jgi:hypothetical protein
MQPESSKPNQPTKGKGYGKRPLWQWVLLYIVAAIVVYGLIYLLFFQKSGVSGGY